MNISSHRVSIKGMKRNELKVGLFCFIFGAVLVFIITRQELNNNKKLTVRILQNSIIGLKASQSLALSCSKAYSTATACVSNLNACNIKIESQKLDTFNREKETANIEIKKSNEELERIIQEVKADK